MEIFSIVTPLFPPLFFGSRNKRKKDEKMAAVGAVGAVAAVDLFYIHLYINRTSPLYNTKTLPEPQSKYDSGHGPHSRAILFMEER